MPLHSNFTDGFTPPLRSPFQVIGEIEALLKKQAVVLKHEEATAIRHFKEKLSDIEKQVWHVVRSGIFQAWRNGER